MRTEVIVVCLCVFPVCQLCWTFFTENEYGTKFFQKVLKICNLQYCLKASVSGDTASLVKFSATSAILFARDPPYGHILYMWSSVY